MSAQGLYASALAVAAAIGLSTGAPAADMPVKEPGVVPIYNWTGLYLGLNGGYGWSSEPIALTASPAAVQMTFLEVPGVTSIAGDPKGYLGGAQLGYNVQKGRIVYGVEADIDHAHISSSQDINRVVGVVGRTYHGEQKLDWLGTVRGRLGYTPVDRLLVYATGGLAVGHASVNFSLTTDAGCTIGTCLTGPSTSKTLWGWALGGGLEYALAPHWSVKGEYLYYDLGDIDTTVHDPAIPSWAMTGTAHMRGNVARAGLNYKFN